MRAILCQSSEPKRFTGKVCQQALVDEVAECWGPNVIAGRWEVTSEGIIIIDGRERLFLMKNRMF